MATTIAVLGGGSWGTAVAALLARDPSRRVTLWVARPDSQRQLLADRENACYLPGVPLPDALEVTADPAAVAGADLWVSAIPTAHLRQTLARFAGPIADAPTPVLSLTKGLEQGTFLRPTEVICEVLGPRPVAALSGPSHAEEVSRGRPASLVAASPDAELARAVQSCFNSPSLRVYTNRDLLGVELAGAVKNVIGIAAGVCDGLGFGDNAKSALMARGLREMARFGVALGAEAETFAGLAGVGDLITTCVSPHGRNRRVGELLGRGQSLAEILASTSMVAEGVTTAKSVHERAGALGVPVPIVSAVYRVLYEGLSAFDAVRELMEREPCEE